MTAAIGIYLLGLAAFLTIFMFVQHLRGSWELLSIRNVAIGGFIIFQLLSGTIALLTGFQGPQFIESPAATGFIYGSMATVFLVLALWVYGRGFGATWLADRMPTMRGDPNDGVLIAMAVLFLVLAAVFKFVLVYLPILGILSELLADAMAAAACGVAGWLWGRRFFNPMVIMIVCAVAVTGMLITLYGAFGRRGMVAIGAALVWGLYYSNLRFRPMPVILRRTALVAAPAVLVIALFTAARAYTTTDRTIESRLVEMRQRLNPNEIRGTLVEMMAGQGAGAWSMWLIESYPEDFEYRHLKSLVHFLVYPVPRAFWEDKPTALGIELPQMALIQDVDRGALNVGVGIIGSAAADGGWYALIIYAVIAGVFLRFFDQLVINQAHSPFVVIPVGATLGQTLALARGETSAFAALMVIGVAGTFVTMIVLHFFIVRTGLAHDTYDEEEMDEALDDPGGPDGPFLDEPELDPMFDPAGGAAIDRRFDPDPRPGPRWVSPASPPLSDGRTNGSVRPPGSSPP